MAFSAANSPTNTFGRSRFRTSHSLSEINIVPLVDVLLVVLVIFMLTAHVMEFGLEVDVPEVAQTRSTAEILPVVAVTKKGDVQLNDKIVNINSLAGEIQKKFPKAKEVYVRADANVIFRPLAQVISVLNEAKIKVKLVTKPMEERRR